MTRLEITVAIYLLSGIMTGGAGGQSLPPTTAPYQPKSLSRQLQQDRKSHDPKVLAAIANKTVSDMIPLDLGSGDPVRQREALGVLNESMINNAGWCRENLETKWLDSLLVIRQYDLIHALIDEALTGEQDRTAGIASVQYCRVRALMAQEKYEEALSAAKSYYNVVDLEKTDAAIRLICEVLANGRAQKETGIVHRFRQQQESLARMPASADGPAVALPMELGENILAAVVVDAKPYGQWITDASGGHVDFQSLTARGNLLLLADRCKEAQAVFQDAADLANDQELPLAVANLARGIRARDSSVGRANAYILSLRKPGGGL